MPKNRSALFRGGHFEDRIIILCVRWYLRYSLSLREVEELLLERGLEADHTTVWRLGLWSRTAAAAAPLPLSSSRF